MSMMIGNNMGISSSYQNNVNKADGYKSVREYSNYLMDKYSCLTLGKNVAVSVTSGLLRKAMSDAKTGEWLERELTKAPDYIKSAQQVAIAHGSKLISVSIEFGEEYSTMTTIGVFGEVGTDSDIDKWMKRIKESKEEKRATEENLKEQRTAEYSYTFKGSDLKSVADSFIEKMSTLSSTMSFETGFDMKV